MKRIRVRVIILVLWLISFYLMDRLLDPIAISNLAICLVITASVFSLVLPRFSEILITAGILFLITVLFGAKYARGELSGTINILLTTGEALAIVITSVLVRWVGMSLKEFEKAVTQVTLGQPEKVTESVLPGHETIYREVRRARNHQRPLALLAIGIDEKTINLPGERKTQEIQFFMMKQLKLREISKMLCKELEDCAIIVKESDHFLAVLPETSPEEALVVIERLRNKATVEVGVDIKVGMASLPKDSYTFEGLVDLANREMQTDREPVPYLLLDRYPVERPVKEYDS